LKTVEIKDATAPLSDYARQAKKEPVMVTSNGKPMVAVIDMTGVDAETISLSTNPKFLSILEHSRSRRKTEGSISASQMRLRLGLKRKRSK